MASRKGKNGRKLKTGMKFTNSKKLATSKSKPPLKDTEQMGPPPDIKYSGQPLPQLRAKNDVLMAFLPWLALGFAPTKTSGAGSLCGLRALWRAFRDARDALKAPGAPPIGHFTQTQFKGLLGNRKYNEKVQELLDSDAYQLFTPEEKEQVKDDLNVKEYLDITQLSLLLEVANDVAGTNFTLGYVTAGWRCKINKSTDVYENNFLKETTAALAGDPTGYREANLIQRPARPVIWLWNDDFAQKSSAWNQGSDNLNHWEGFGAYEHSDVDRQNVVKNWKLGKAVADDLKNGVWMLTRDCLKTNGNELDVRRGTFVRDAVPSCFVPSTSRFVVAYNGMQGLVPRDGLKKINLHHATPPLPDPKSSGCQQESESEGQGNQNKEILLQLNFFRAVEPTDKIGGVAKMKFSVGGFDFNCGDFLLDTTYRHNGNPVVTDISGKTGEAHFRRLQSLETPWGLPVQTEIFNEEMVRGGENMVPLSPAAKSLNRWPLPLVRLNRAYSAEEAQGESEFFLGEIVRIAGQIENGGYIILDFESNFGTVCEQDLEFLGSKGVVGQSTFPFGVHLTEQLLGPELGAASAGEAEVVGEWVATLEAQAADEPDAVEDPEAINEAEIIEGPEAIGEPEAVEEPEVRSLSKSSDGSDHSWESEPSEMTESPVSQETLESSSEPEPQEEVKSVKNNEANGTKRSGNDDTPTVPPAKKYKTNE